MTRTEVAPTTGGDDLLARAREAVPKLARHAARAEKDRRVSPESIVALREAGAFALTTPARFGGLDADLVTSVRVLAELACGCPSSAWLAAVSADAKTHFTPMMSQQLQEEFYTDPDVRLCGAGAPPGVAKEVPSGLRFSGRWPYASGCEDVPRAQMVVAVSDGDRFLRLVGVQAPVSELVIERTWDTAGLRGTGSHTLVADDVFVPSSHVLEMPPGPDGTPDFSAGRPLIFLSGALTLLAPMVGTAQGALDTVRAVLGKRKPPMTSYDCLADSPAARQLFAEATHLVDSADRGLVSLAERVESSLPGHSTPLVERSGMRMELITIIQQCRQAVDKLLDLHGSSGLALDNPLQRFWRDLHVGTRHLQFTSYLAVENHGLLLSGGSPVSVV